MNDMSIAEIESAIRQLPAEKVGELMAWLANYYEQLWDREIEADLDAGRLDAVLSQVDAEIEAGLAKPV